MTNNKNLHMGEGNTADIYDIGNGKILKLFKNDFPTELCQYEYSISTEIYKHFGISPITYELIREKDKNGIIFEKIDGISFLKYLTNKPWKYKKKAAELAHIQFDMHKDVNFEIDSAKDKLKYLVDCTEELDEEKKDYLLKYIELLPDGTKLCHGDLHPGNIILSKNKAVIIDWMTAVKGDPLYDVSRTIILTKHGDMQIKSKIVRLVVSKIRCKICWEYLNEYLRLSGEKIEDVEKWELPIMAARLSEWITDSERLELLKLIEAKFKNLK